jgi:hypothetical protein
LKKTLIAVLALVSLMSAQEPSATNTSKAAIAQAIRGVDKLRGMMRDPDSFVIERVFTWAKKPGQDRTCYQYRSRNGYGGMSREIGYYTEHDGKAHVEANAATRMFPTCPKHFTEITDEFKVAQKAAAELKKDQP